MQENYTMEEHVHRYAIWTAARAASIGRFSNREIAAFIEENKLRQELNWLRERSVTPADYKEWFIKMTEGIKESMEKLIPTLEKKPHRNISFGIAAKVVSIYVKTSEIIRTGGDSQIAKVAIPPIDSYLLQALKQDRVSWSKLEKNEYMILVDELEKENNGHPFWKLEAFWNLSGINE